MHRRQTPPAGDSPPRQSEMQKTQCPPFPSRSSGGLTFTPVAPFSSLPRDEAVSPGLRSPVPSQTHVVRGSYRPEQTPLKMGEPSTYRSVNFLNRSCPTVQIWGSLKPLSCPPGVRGGWAVLDALVAGSWVGGGPQFPSRCRIWGAGMTKSLSLVLPTNTLSPSLFKWRLPRSATAEIISYQQSLYRH